MRKSFLLFFVLLATFHCAIATAQTTILYSYEAFTVEETRSWGLIPILVSGTFPSSGIEEKSQALFQSIKARKLPIYGQSLLQQNELKIDSSKCDFAQMIGAEIRANFELYSLPTPKISCSSQNIEQNLITSHFLPIIPLWQAISPDFHLQGLVKLDDQYMRMNEFKEKLQNRDKAIIARIENLLKSNDNIAKSVAIKLLPSLAGNSYENKILPFLKDKDSSIVFAAVSALKNSKNPKTIDMIDHLLHENASTSSQLRQLCFGDANPKLTRSALLLEIKSDDPIRMKFALGEAEKLAELGYVSENLPALYTLSPANLRSLSTLLLEKNETEGLEKELNQPGSSPELIFAAREILEQENARNELKQNALAFLLQHGTEAEAFRAWDELKEKNDAPHLSRALFNESDEVWKMALAALKDLQFSEKFQILSLVARNIPKRARVIEWTMAQEMKNLPPQTLVKLKNEKNTSINRAISISDSLNDKENKQNQNLIAMAITKPESDSFKELLKKSAFHTNPELRKDAAFSLRFLKDMQSLERTQLLKDKDPEVLALTLDSLATSKTYNAAEEILQNAKSIAPEYKILSLKYLPELVSEKNEKAILNFVSNEAFDSNLQTKIEAIRALSKIVRNSKSPEMQSNALMSLALTLKDPNPTISQLTIWELAKTKSPQAVEPISQALQHEETLTTALEAIAHFPSIAFRDKLGAWVEKNQAHPMIKNASALLSKLK